MKPFKELLLAFWMEEKNTLSLTGYVIQATSATYCRLLLLLLFISFFFSRVFLGVGHKVIIIGLGRGSGGPVRAQFGPGVNFHAR